MAPPKPKWIAMSLAQEFTSESFVSLQIAVASHVSTKIVSMSVEEAADFAEQNLPVILAHLNEIRSELTDDGVEPTFEIEGDIGDAYIRGASSAAKDFRMQMLEMDPMAFEDLCKRILIAIGAREGARLGKSADGGVDFVARDLHLVIPASVGARIHIVGQAKRYALSHPVKETELRDFVGGAIRRLSDPDDLEVYRPEVLAPVIFAFWTTSEFNSSALAYAKAVGLWHLNGLGLAQLALRNSVTLHPETATA
jgi:restriction endonuclease Mrr